MSACVRSTIFSERENLIAVKCHSCTDCALGGKARLDMNNMTRAVPFRCGFVADFLRHRKNEMHGRALL